MEDGMRFLRTTLCVLALASPLAGCFSYDRDEGDHGYHGRYYDHPGDYYGDDGGSYYYYHRD